MNLMHKVVSVLVTIGISNGAVFAYQSSLPPVTVEFRFAESSPGKGLTGVTVYGTNQRVYLHKECIVSHKDIIEARAIESVNLFGGTSRLVEVVFSTDGAQRMAKATKSRTGRLLAILVDGEVISAPVVRGTIYERAAISSETMTKEEAERIAAALNRMSFSKTRKLPITSF